MVLHLLLQYQPHKHVHVIIVQKFSKNPDDKVRTQLNFSYNTKTSLRDQSARPTRQLEDMTSLLGQRDDALAATTSSCRRRRQ